MGRSTNKLHITLMSTFLLICISCILFLLVRSEGVETRMVQSKMSDAGAKRMDLIAKTLEGTSFHDNHTDGSLDPLNKVQFLLVVYADQDCGSCLSEMIDLLERIISGFNLPVFAVNLSGERHFPVENLIYLDSGIIRQDSQLRNVPTPILVYADSTGTISAVFSATLFDDREREEKFLILIQKLVHGRRGSLSPSPEQVLMRKQSIVTPMFIFLVILQKVPWT